MCQSTCFSDYITSEQDTISFNAKLKPSTNYFYVITDRFGNKTSKAFATDANGLWQIAKVDLPDGFLAPGNKFKVEVLNDQDDLVPMYMIVQTPVKELHVEVKQTTGAVKNFVGGNWDN